MRLTACSTLQLIFATVLAVNASYAHAADLGGDCCVDLEERIVELETTTARKGNRKVKLTISGYVAQELTWWDDGAEANVYLHGLGPTQTTHFKFNGSAKIAPGWTAGYMLRIQSLADNPFGRSGTDSINQNDDDFSQGLNVQMSYWYLQSVDFGSFSVGKQAPAAKSVAMFTDKSATQIVDNYTFLDGFPQFIIRSGGDLEPAALTWGQLAFCYSQNVPLGGDCDGLVMNAVRYDTPVLSGFSASASLGEDDDWQIAARYTGEVGGFKLLAGLGYSKSTDEKMAVIVPSLVKKDSGYLQAGGYAEHIQSGLFVHGAYGYENNSGTVLTGGITPADGEHWFVKAGVRQKWLPLGTTIIYGDYGQYFDQIGPSARLSGVTSSELDVTGGGVIQEIDAAAMSVWLKYRNFSGDISGGPIVGSLDDLNTVSLGALVNF